MHELAIAENIVRNVQQLSVEHNINTIEVVNIKIGVLQQVSRESLLFLLEAVTKGTDLEAVRFNLERVDAAIECSTCGRKSNLQGYLLRCPACGKSDVKVRSGNELFIDSIEVPDEEVLDT